MSAPKQRTFIVCGAKESVDKPPGWVDLLAIDLASLGEGRERFCIELFAVFVCVAYLSWRRAGEQEVLLVDSPGLRSGST
jgi:hypothetical protein